jgi:hypothetical protein
MQTTVSLDDKLFHEAAYYARTNNPGELLHMALQDLSVTTAPINQRQSAV